MNDGYAVLHLTSSYTTVVRLAGRQADQNWVLAIFFRFNICPSVSAFNAEFDVRSTKNILYDISMMVFNGSALAYTIHFRGGRTYNAYHLIFTQNRPTMWFTGS